MRVFFFLFLFSLYGANVTVDPIHHTLQVTGCIPLTKGVEPIFFYYTAESFNPHLTLEINANLTEVHFHDTQGALWKYKRKHKKNSFHLDLKIVKSLSNSGTDFSSLSHPLNVSIQALNHSEVTVNLPNGTQRFYTLEKQLLEAYFNKNRFYQLLLRQEILPSKMVLKYDYQEGLLRKTSLFDPSGQNLIDSVEFFHKADTLTANCYGKEALRYQKTSAGYTLFRFGLFLERFCRPYEGIRGVYENATGDYKEFSLENGCITETYLKDQQGNLFLSQVYKRAVFTNVNLIFDSKGSVQVLESDGYRIIKNSFLDRKNFLVIDNEVEDKKGVFGSAKELFLERVLKNAYESQMFFHHPTKALLERKYFLSRGVLLQSESFFYQNFDLVESRLYQDSDRNSSTALDFDEKNGEMLQGSPIQIIRNTLIEVNGVKKIQKRELSNGLLEEIFFDCLGRQSSINLFIDNKLLKKEMFSYDFCNRVIERSEEDADGVIKKITSYRYNEIGQIREKVHKSPTRTLFSTLYLYNSLYDLEEEWQLNGLHEVQNKTYTSYDSYCRRLTQKNDFGEGVQYFYDSAGFISAQIDLSTGVKTEFFYDKRGLLVETISPRGKEQIIYDRHKRPIECLDKHGGVRKQKWNSQNKLVEVTLSKNPTEIQTVRYKYDALGHLQEEIDPLGNRIRYKNDLKGNKKWVHMSGYDVSFFYDHFGLMTEKNFQGKNIQKDIYDPLGRVIKTVREGKESLFFYNSFDIVREKRFDGTDIFYTYDDAGLLIEEIIIKGGVKATKKSSYDANQNPVKVEFVEKEQIISRNFDKKHRLIEERIEDFKGEIFSHKKYSYDYLGNLEKVSLLIDGKWSITKKEHDIWGRETACIDPLGNKTQFFYETSLSVEGTKLEKKTKIFPNGLKEVHYIDPFQEIVSFCVYDPRDTLIKKEIYKRDAVGNLLELELIYQTIEGEKSQIITYSYDSAGKLLEKVIDAQSLKPQITRYTYDKNGRLSLLKKPSGTEIFYTYTDFEEISRILSSDGSIDYCYLYNEQQNLIEARNGLTGHSTYYTYNKLGLVVSEELENGQLTQFEYDAHLQINACHFALAGSLFFQSGPFGVKSLIRQTPQNEQIEFFFDRTQGGDALKNIGLPFNLGSVQFFYDLDGRVEKKLDFSGSDRIEKKSCFGSPLKRGVIDPFKTTTLHYSYNFQDELETFSDDLLEVVYNGAGVPDFFGGSKVLYDSKLQVKNCSNCIYGYDPQGNLFFQKGKTGQKEYRYDALDRLTEIHLGEIKILFFYDFKHRLIQKKTVVKGREKTVDYLYQNLQEVGTVDHETQELLEFRTIFMEKENRPFFTLMVETKDTLYVAFQDIFYNLVGLFNPKTSLWESFCHFSPFGKKNPMIQKIDCPWSYKQSRYICEADLFIFGMRYYDPQTHQFLSKDPLGEKWGYYGHRFCNNNPIKYDDPSGMSPIDTISVDITPFIQSFLNHLYEGKELSWDSLISTSKGEILFPVESFAKTLYATGSYLARTLRPFLEKERTAVEKRGQKAFRENQRELFQKKSTEVFSLESWHPLVHRIFPDGCLFSQIQSQTFDLFTNGVGNSLLDAKESAKTVANHLKKEVFLVYNSSISLIHDVYRAARSKIFRAKGDVVHLLEKIAHGILEDPSRNLRIWAHSEGALNTALAFEQFPEEKKERLIVHTFGAAELIPKCFGGKVINFVSDKDAVSMGANMHILMHHSRERTTISFTQPIKGVTIPVYEIQNSQTGHCYNIVFLRSKSKIDHFFKGESYQWALQLAHGYEKTA